MTNAERCAQFRRNRDGVLGLLKKEREEARFMMRARLAKRDLEYAGSPCAARVTVDCVRTTDGRPLVVETRGRAVVGFRASGIIRQN